MAGYETDKGNTVVLQNGNAVLQAFRKNWEENSDRN